MTQNTLTAAIVINAQSIDLSVTNLTTLKQIEHVSSPVALGDHLFTSGGINPGTVDDAVKTLHGFQQLMKDDGVTEVEIIASHAVAQAANISYVQDQIYVRTGLKIKLLTTNEELMYRFQASAILLPHFKKMMHKGTVVVQLGASVLTLMVCQHGEITLVRELPLGPMRVAQSLAGLERQVTSYEDVLDDYLSAKLLSVWRLLPEKHFDQVILMGSKLTLLDNLIPLDQRSVLLSHQQFDQRFNDVMKLSEQDLADRLPQLEADEVSPMFLLMDQILDHLHVSDIHLTNIKLIDGFMVHLSDNRNQLKTSWNFEQVIVTEAQNIANRYAVDQRHQRQVMKFALQLFDRLKKVHGLTKRDRILLQLAAILQDTGLYVDGHHHSFHSEYLIRNSEIIGLNDREQSVVAVVARHHSIAASTLDQGQLHHFRLSDQLRIAKLAAILRLADALDESYQSKIGKIHLRLNSDRVVITAESTSEIALEQWSFRQKADFFQHVFGLTAILKSNRPTK